MRREEVQELIDKQPFEPFRVKLMNADFHDVFDPQTLAIQDFFAAEHGGKLGNCVGKFNWLEIFEESVDCR